jgi:hypothetical protein
MPRAAISRTARPAGLYDPHRPDHARLLAFKEAGMVFEREWYDVMRPCGRRPLR